MNLRRTPFLVNKTKNELIRPSIKLMDSNLHALLREKFNKFQIPIFTFLFFKISYNYILLNIK